MSNSISQAKENLRQQIKLRLAGMTVAEMKSANDSIRVIFGKLAEVTKARNIMLYYSVRHEVDTQGLIADLFALGKTVALPICQAGASLVAGRITKLSELVAAKYGLMEPGPDAILIDPANLDLIVVPGLAFDGLGNRLGHGAGYYDRFLSRLPQVYKLGLAHERQVITNLPATAKDTRVNGLITPSGFRDFGSPSADPK